MKEISVKVTAHSGRKYLIMYYDCPLTGKRFQRSTKEPRRRDAERVAAKWEAELREGRYKKPSVVTWEDFRQRFYEDRLKDAVDKTRSAYETALNAFERHLKVGRLAELTSERITFASDRFVKIDKLSVETARSYAGHLRGALNWAKKRGLLVHVPEIELAKRSKGDKLSKGRPITLEEFERLLAKVEAGIVATSGGVRPGEKKRPRSAAVLAKLRQQRESWAVTASSSWRRLLWGIWYSGLRLGEAMELSWDENSGISIDLEGRRPMLRIRSDSQKGNRDTLLPMAPEFAEYVLAEYQPDQRRGLVFPIPAAKGGLITSPAKASNIISAMGEAARIVVDSESGKFASAHDLRRAFGFRWASRVMPAVLKDLMRHTEISTTMKYYVGQNAEQTADVIWSAFEEKTGRSVGTSVGSSQKSNKKSLAK